MTTPLLVSFCNQVWTPALSLAVVDPETGEATWISLPLGGEPDGVSGVAGVASLPDGFVMALQHPDRGLLIRYDAQLRPLAVLEVEGAKDIHALHYRDTDRTVFLTSTGTDQVIACRLNETLGEIVEQRVAWQHPESAGVTDEFHVNAITELKGRLVVSMFGSTADGSWKGARKGCLMDIGSGEELAHSLHHPHSIWAHGEDLFLAESGTAVIRRISADGRQTLYPPLEGYLRGLAGVGGTLYIGRSAARVRSRSVGTPNVDVGGEEEAAAAALIQIDIETGELIAEVEFSALGREIFDVVPLYGHHARLSYRSAAEVRVQALELRVDRQHEMIRLALDEQRLGHAASDARAIGLERALQDSAAHAMHLDSELTQVRLGHEQLARRRSVRTALRLAALTKPLFVLVRLLRRATHRAIAGGVRRRGAQFRAVARREGLPAAVRAATRVARRQMQVVTQVVAEAVSHGVDRELQPHERLVIQPDLSEGDAALLLADAAQPGPVRSADIICLSVIDWDFRYQRPQQLMSQFAAAGHRVFYVSHSRHLPDSRTGPGRIAVKQIKDNVFEVSLAAADAPSIYQEVLRGDVRDSMLRSLDELRHAYGIQEAVTYAMIASWAEVALEARELWGWAALYDCIDEWENFPNVSSSLVAAERRLVRDSDIMLASAEALRAKWTPVRSGPIHLVRNAADCDHFVEGCRPNGLFESHGGGPVIGYYGAISAWFDVELVAEVARKRRDWQFVLIGEVSNVDISSLEQLSNVRFLGEKPYKEIPGYLYHFDVCLIPFVLNHLTNATDPVKVYEYLSVGKPVVATRLGELAGYEEHVRLADGAAEFYDAIAAALDDGDAATRQARSAFALANTWRARYETAAAAIEADLTVASVVVLTFNNLAKTRACLTSLLRNTGWSAYEVIVVDNASTDDTPAYLEALSAADPRVRVVLNDQNRGFAAGNNQGLEIARGEHLVLLNNDTIVPQGWLTRLLRHLDDAGVGLVGPTTNWVGNEARLEVPYRTWREMEDFAAERAKRYRGLRADIPMLAMFCLAMRRDTFERLGPLDERFGVGMFEDDDYTLRAKQAGLRVVCAGDAFVHHFGMASFKLLRTDGTYDALFAKNRALFEEKWGEAWQPHKSTDLAFSPRGVR